MKKLLFAFILSVLLVLGACGEKTAENPQIPATSEKSETFESRYDAQEELDTWLHKYVNEFIDSEVRTKLNDNPLDKAYYVDADKTKGTYDDVMLNWKYVELWEKEMDLTIDKLNKVLEKQLEITKTDDETIRYDNTKSAIETLKKSQKEWEDFYQTDVDLSLEMFRSFAGRATIGQIQSSLKCLNMVRLRTMQLKEYLSKFPRYEIEFYGTYKKDF